MEKDKILVTVAGIGVIALCLTLAVYVPHMFGSASAEANADTPTVVCDAFTVNDSVEIMCFAQGNVSVEFGFNESNVHGTLWTGETHG